MPQSSMVVPVAELLRRPGSHRTLSLRADLGGLSTSTAEISSPVELQVRLESVHGGLEATGSLQARWQGSCRRCLEPINEAVRQDVREMFGSNPTDDQTYPIVDGEVDLTAMVRDSLVLSLPIAPLCSEECVGPAPDAYPMTQPEADHGERPKDPRWAALDALRTGQ